MLEKVGFIRLGCSSVFLGSSGRSDAPCQHGIGGMQAERPLCQEPWLPLLCWLSYQGKALEAEEGVRPHRVRVSPDCLGLEGPGTKDC